MGMTALPQRVLMRIFVLSKAVFKSGRLCIELKCRSCRSCNRSVCANGCVISPVYGWPIGGLRTFADCMKIKMQVKVDRCSIFCWDSCRKGSMFIGFVILGSVGGAVAAAVALLLGASLMLVALSYSLTGLLSVLGASTIYVIVSGGLRHQLVNQDY